MTRKADGMPRETRRPLSQLHQRLLTLSQNERGMETLQVVLILAVSCLILALLVRVGGDLGYLADDATDELLRFGIDDDPISASVGSAGSSATGPRSGGGRNSGAAASGRTGSNAANGSRVGGNGTSRVEGSGAGSNGAGSRGGGGENANNGGSGAGGNASGDGRDNRRAASSDDRTNGSNSGRLVGGRRGGQDGSSRGFNAQQEQPVAVAGEKSDRWSVQFVLAILAAIVLFVLVALNRMR